MGFHIIIPARYQSSRFPEKVLADIGGKPMLQHVFERAEESGAESIVIATDDERVRKVAEGFGATVCMTADTHETGTERIAETIDIVDYEEDDVIVGLQADEPFLPANVIKKLAGNLLTHDNIKIASICTPLTDPTELFNPSVTKVVLNHRNNAMYFSRAPIPWERGNFPVNGNQPDKLLGKHFRHIGLYAYRASFLSHYIEMEACPLEEMELLEQLRVLWNGGRIHMTIIKQQLPSGVDTEADLQAVRQHYKSA
jgi:3-deoxy-manno-octulosonate cytidylyltransferase (CMP-KDO synthetase)